MPQFGWQPHFSDAPVGAGPVEQVGDVREGALDAESGNQSRSGSVTPVCAFTSCARCDSV